MTAVFAGDAPAHLRQVEAVEVLRQTWVQEYFRQPDPVHEDPVHALPGPQSVHHLKFTQPHPAPKGGARSAPVSPS
jgi:hypothetical protein